MNCEYCGLDFDLPAFWLSLDEFDVVFCSANCRLNYEQENKKLENKIICSKCNGTGLSNW